MSTTVDVKPAKTCEIRDVLPPSVVELLGSAPHNDTVRAVILAHLRQPIPEDKRTFEEIRDWIETTIPAPVKPQSRGWAPVDTGAPATPVNMISFAISGSETETGKIFYEVLRSGRANYQISERDFLRMAADSESMSDLVELVTDEISEDWTETVELDSYGDFEYGSIVEGSQDYDNSEWEFNIPIGIRRFIYEQLHRLNPEELNRILGGDEPPTWEDQE